MRESLHFMISWISRKVQSVGFSATQQLRISISNALKMEALK